MLQSAPSGHLQSIVALPKTTNSDVTSEEDMLTITMRFRRISALSPVQKTGMNTMAGGKHNGGT